MLSLELNNDNQKPALTTLKNVDPYFSHIDIYDWFQQKGQAKTFIGEGRNSQAYIVRDGDSLYIVRVTHILNAMQRKMIQNEITIYDTILENANANNYISELLYASCPITYSESYSDAFFVFRYVQGLPLKTLIQSFIKNNLKLASNTIQKWRKQMLDILDFLQDIGIIHRDLKPENIYVDTQNDRLLIFDFDSACRIGHDCISNEFRGTREYAQPELKRLLEPGFHAPYEYSQKNDLHAVSVIFEKDLPPITK